MKFSDIAGDVAVSSNDAKQFVQTWFKGDDLICISGLRSERTGGTDAVSQSMTAWEFVMTTDDDSLRDTVFDEDGNRWNIYVSVCPVKEGVTLKQRGTKSNVAYVPGVWADLDVKPGSFSSQEEILDWLKTLALQPTIIVSSGSSGVHAYWRLKWDQVGSEDLADSWWAYLNEMAGERSIDHLVDVTRILRLPGTIRFPKKDEKAKLGAVRIIEHHTDQDHRYTTDQIWAISGEAMARKTEQRRKTIREIAERRMRTDETARALLGADTKWGLLQAHAYVEDFVNDNWDWARILEPYGWKYRRTMGDGSKEWARPGQNDRSAVVDYNDSPVMSLLSQSEATGLLDLKEAGVPLTKYTVALRLMFNDDEDEMVRYVIEQQKAYMYGEFEGP